MSNQSAFIKHEQEVVTHQEVRPTQVCFSTEETTPSTSTEVTQLPLAGAIGKTDVNGAVNLTPLRDNPMGYYLREIPDAMQFTNGQVKVMREQLINGEQPLVAAQLGDTANLELRVCAVWSPNVMVFLCYRTRA